MTQQHHKHTSADHHAHSNLVIEQRGGKNRTVAGLLALLPGGIGIHKFYLSKVG